MKSLRFLTIAPFALLVTGLSAQVNIAAPSSISLHDFARKGVPAQYILQELAERYKFVIGLYGALIGRDQLRTIDIEIRDGTLEQAFDAVTKADPPFQWRKNGNGSVHFMVSSAPLSLVDVTLRSIDDENPQEDELADRLFDAPEIRGWLQEHRCVREHYIITSGPLPKPWGTFSVHAKDQPLSAVMDEVAAKSHTYFWDAIQYSRDPCRVDIEWGNVQPNGITP